MQLPTIKFMEIDFKKYDMIIDVRSPSEYQLDHIIGATNLPALSDMERIEVGTIYKKQSRFKARKVGATRISRNVASHIEKHLFEKDRKWRPLLYCWRGGQRSFAFGTILAQIGWRPTLLYGGYKKYRRSVVDVMHKNHSDLRLILVSGHTGTGKTELLQTLRALDTQIIDLEALANHRGSVLGRGVSCQPSQKLFESLLFREISTLDPHKPIFVEAESSKIGNITIPPAFWCAMKNAQKIEIVAPIKERARYLKRTYQNLTSNVENLCDRLDFLVRQQGRKRVDEWKTLAREKKYEHLAVQLMELHYDKRYSRSRQPAQTSISLQIALEKINSREISKAAQKIKNSIGSLDK